MDIHKWVFSTDLLGLGKQSSHRPDTVASDQDIAVSDQSTLITKTRLFKYIDNFTSKN